MNSHRFQNISYVEGRISNKLQATRCQLHGRVNDLFLKQRLLKSPNKEKLDPPILWLENLSAALDLSQFLD